MTMMKCALPIDPPYDNIERIESIMREAFELFLKKGYNRSFQDIYDLVHEEIDGNLEKYFSEGDYNVCCY